MPIYTRKVQYDRNSSNREFVVKLFRNGSTIVSRSFSLYPSTGSSTLLTADILKEQVDKWVETAIAQDKEWLKTQDNIDQIIKAVSQ